MQARQTELTTKQEELHNTNEELQEKAQLLENEKRQVEAKNLEIEMARLAVEEKAEQLEVTSKYKSEFLANMSHELRTPLNSLLILSKLLADNPQGNLNTKQTEFARTINSAGTDLLSLINDILDLSKIESGTVSIELGDMPLASLRQHMERTFRQLASDKGLHFDIVFDNDLPTSIRTDEKRLQQVVLNLLSNAFKFTAEGAVTLEVSGASTGWSANHPVLEIGQRALSIAVTDTGIGIPDDKQKLIFEAFQQADGTTSRKFGGTGLGLSISREIARLLGGELQVQSRPGEGSTFTLYVPLTAVELAPAKGEVRQARELNGGAEVGSAALAQTIDIADDRDSLDGQKFVLIVEDDPAFASILLDIAREVGLKAVVSNAGAGTLALVRKLKPDAITLDLGLADIDGWVLLDLLKHDADSAHLPIHVISGASQLQSVVDMGAFGVTEKPASHEQLAAVFSQLRDRVNSESGDILILSGNKRHRKAMADALSASRCSFESAETIEKAMSDFEISAFQTIVLIADSARAAIAQASALTSAALAPNVRVAILGEDVPLVTSIAETLSKKLSVLTANDAANLAAELAQTKAAQGHNISHAADQGAFDLSGARILIVDDDIRNIYSLTSVLESYQVDVVHAERGRDGILILEQSPDIDVALIDIMMPEMDGYETMREIRKRPSLIDLPLISVTAKAMKGDRQKCLDAGASDYIAKPVDIDLLLALLRVWVARSRERMHSPLMLSAAE